MYEYREGHHLLISCEPHCSHDHIKAVQEGEIMLTLAAFPSVLMVCMKTETFPWENTPYNWHLTEPAEARVVPPEVGEKEQVSLLLVLVEVITEQIVARRGMSLPPCFGNLLHETLRQQAHTHFDETFFLSQWAKLQQEYPTAQDLVDSCTQTIWLLPSVIEQHGHLN